MKRTWRLIAAGMGLALAWGMPASGQGVVARGQACEGGVRVGTLGISGLDCVGECSVIVSRDGTEERWIFTTEPRIFTLHGGGPAEGILEAGDYLVSIDGLLITTREGGLRYADLKPGETVAVRYRRGGEIREARIRVGSRCSFPPEPSVSAGRVPPPPPADAVRGVARVGIATAPRVKVLPSPVAPDSALPAVATGVVSRGRLLDPTPRGRLGIGLQCSHCGTELDRDSGRSVWFFSGPIEVTSVAPGGPAEKVGIQMGDLITAVDGHDISTEAGGLAFSNLVPGKAVRLTVVRRNGSKEDLTLVPDEPERAVVAGLAVPTPDAAPPTPRAVGVAVDPPPPARGTGQEPVLQVGEPVGLPLSYSGSLEGVEVTVRGGPVAVSELKGARTLIINTDGLWIRLRIPVPGGQEEEGTHRRR